MPSSTSSKRREGGPLTSSGGGGGGPVGDDGGGGDGGGGDLVKVGFARNRVEAEMLQGLLLDSGINSILKRTAGFDNPDFLASGPHDIWVNKGHAPRAREILEETTLESEGEEEAEIRGEEAGPRPTSPERLALYLLAALVVVALLAWLGAEAFG